MTDPNEPYKCNYCTGERMLESHSDTTQNEMEDLQSDLKAERQKTEQLRDALRKLDVEFDYIMMHVQMSQMMNPNTNGWIIDKLRKMKRGVQKSMEKMD